MTNLQFKTDLKIKIVTTMGFEPIRLAAPPPQDGESTNSSTRPLLLSVLVKDLKKSHHAGYEFCSKK